MIRIINITIVKHDCIFVIIYNENENKRLALYTVKVYISIKKKWIRLWVYVLKKFEHVRA